jgi:hypothetical protein
MEMAMHLTAFAILLGAGLVIAPGASHAQDMAQPGDACRQEVAAPKARHPLSIRPLAWMDLTPRKPLARPYHTVAPQDADDHVPTAVSARIATNGPVGSIGIVSLSASHAIDPSWMSNAVANQPGAPSQTAGAQLAYNFR